MIMLSAASAGSLDYYAEGIRQLTIIYPRSWSHIYLADEKMRSEHWNWLRETMRRPPSVMHPAPVGLVPSRPWDYILVDSAFGLPRNSCVHWWFTQVQGPLNSRESHNQSSQHSRGRSRDRQTRVGLRKFVKFPSS
jgi:hypothetical protein